MNHRLILLVVLILVATTSFGQNLDSAKVYTFGCLKIAGSNTDQFNFSRARIGTDVFKSGEQARVEYDVTTSSLTYAYVQINNLPITIQIGQYLNPVGWFYPGPSKIQLPRYQMTWAGYSGYLKGVCGIWDHDWLTTRVAVFTSTLTEKTEMSSIVTLSSLSGSGIGYESGVGPTLFIGNPMESKWLNYNLHFSNRKDGWRGSIQYYANPLSNLRFFTQVEKVRDVDATNTILGKNWITMTGLTLTYKVTMVKLFYDELNHSAVSEVAWSF